MGQRVHTVFLFLLAFFSTACGPFRAIRATEEEHAAIVTGLEKFLAEHAQGSKSGYALEVRNLNTDRDRAAAEVEITSKESGRVTMMRYALRRQDGAWIVMRSRHLNGPILHPQVEQGQIGEPSSASPASSPSSPPPAKKP